MDYNLDALSWRQFEQMTQALVMRHIGPSVSIFGDGPDAGREATWEGVTASLDSLPIWDGYGVLQAKFHVNTGDVAHNLSWLTTQVKSELKEWAKPDTKRRRKPDFLLFTTNVRLSPAGKDSIKQTITDEAQTLGLPLRGARVWEYDDLRGLLDDAADIRAAYSALITPGDLISRLIDQSDSAERIFAEALTLHAANDFEEDTYLKLSQTGTYGDRRIAISDVFVDLPLEDSLCLNGGDLNEDQTEEENVVAALVHRFDDLATTPDVDHALKKRCVLIGGPGQGKSTVTQFLAQVYRARFLGGSSVAADHDLALDIQRVLDRAESINVPHPRARRWPFRIDLTDLADSLASGACNGLLEYITNAISKSSERNISVDRLHDWLGAFPWLLILDGLDEVPKSSNRDQVIKCVHEFNIKSVAAGGDVTILATTRPQGYSEEFNPALFTHIQLASLPLDVALSYARGFIAVRMPEGSSRAESVYKGLVRASADESTANLFTSPLQVTILTVLVETSGQVPRDRWRLFSRYYDVINQRELEKGGELSDLLQEYESDVVFLHRHIGNLLQHRGAGVGDTSATISRDEFLQIISNRLSEMDHEASKVKFLADEFARLVTDRLVFLAVVHEDRIGFEIRSLQEYMTGAFISDLPDADIIPTIRALSIEPYWRNVVLFATGYIFTSRDHLKAEIPQLCEELDDSAAGYLVRLGALLALDILRDGATQSQPRFARRLARQVASLLNGPVQDRVSEFARFSDDVVAPILRDAALSLQPTNSSGWVNRAVASMAILPLGEKRAAHLVAIFTLSDEPARKGLLRLIGDRLDGSLAEALSSYVGGYSPSLVIPERNTVAFRIHHRSEEVLPGWLNAILKVSTGSFSDRIVFDLGHRSRGKMRVSLTPIKGSAEEWATLSDLDFEHAGWRFISKIGSFVANPSIEVLSSLILDLKALDPCDRVFAESGPWVIAACYEAASKYPQAYGAANFDEAIDFIATACMAGELGSVDDWERAENRYRSMRGQSIDPIVGPAGLEEPSASLPIWPGLAEAGISLIGVRVGFLGGHTAAAEDVGAKAADLDNLCELAESVTGAAHLGAVVNYISFASIMIMGGLVPHRHSEATSTPEWLRVRAFLESKVLELSDSSPLWGRWALLGHPEQTQHSGYPAVLEKLGGMKLDDAQFGIGQDGIEWVKDGATYSPHGWRRYRLAISYSPAMITELRDYERAFIDAAADEGEYAADLAALVNLAHASAERLASGSLDPLIASFFEADERGRDELLEQLTMVTTIEKSSLLPLVLRIAHVSMDKYPIRAVGFVEQLAVLQAGSPDLN